MFDALRYAGLLVVLPAAISLIVASSAWRWTGEAGKRRSIALAVALGFVIAYALHPDDLPLVPERHWQWLPHLGLAAAFVGGLSAVRELAWWERALPKVLVIGAVAWQVVPRWETLQPARPLMIPLVAAYLGLIYLLSSLLPERLRGRALVFQLACLLLAVAGYVMVEVSLKIGLSLLPAAAAAGGAWLASLWRVRRNDNQLPFAVLALLPVFTVLAGGGAFVGAIEVPEPRYLLLVIPGSPLVLWLFAIGPLAKVTGFKAFVAQTFAMAIIPVAVLAWALLKPEPVEEWSRSLIHMPEHFAFFNLHFSFFNLRV